MPKLISHYRPMKPKPTPPPVILGGKASGWGKRKTAVAVAQVKPGTGKWVVNKSKSLFTYFQPYGARDKALHPYVVTESLGLWDTWVKVTGGGVNAQAEAVRMAVAKALYAYDPAFSATLRRAGRDLRVVERKKPGQKKARKKFQWVKR